MPLLQRHLSECWKTELPQIKIQLLPALLLSHFSYACHPPIWSIKGFPCSVLKYYKIVKSVNKYSTYITVCQPMEDISSLCSQNIHIFQRRCNRICSVFSVGLNNSYNLPKETIINRLKKYNSTVYRTDTDGTIYLTSDGTQNNINKLSVCLDGDSRN